MASADILTPPIKEETDVPARASVLPKRRTGISNIPPRARFVKPRPNINVLANKASKDVQPSTLESKKTSDETSPQLVPNTTPTEDLTSKQKCTPVSDILPTELIKKESDPLSRPILPKRMTGLPAAPRARFQKPRPNIGSLLNKTPKDSRAQEDSRCTSLNKKKTTDTSKVSTIVQDVSESESLSSVQPDAEKEVPSVTGKKTFDETSPQLIPNTTPTEDLTSKQKCTPVSDILPTELIKKESDPLSRPILPKRMTGLPAAPRARFQRPRPNIGSLLNKTPKDSRAQEDRCTSLNEKKTTDTSKVSTIVQDVSESESLSAVQPNAEKEVPSVTGSSFLNSGPVSTTNIEKESPAVTPIDSESSPVQEISKHHDNGDNHIILPTGSPLTIDENETGGSVVDIVLDELQEREYFQSLERSNVTSDKSKASSGKRSRTTSGSAVEKESPSVNKNLEYPTLKSILNSPRKRSTTKKTHERKKRLANLSDNPSRSEMTMVDLIYWNPSSSPMKIVKPQTAPVQNLITPDENTEPPPSVEEPEDESNSNTPVPKVIINENGEIIIDESSLVVRRKETIDTSIEAVVENDNTTYSSFRKRSAKQWATKETAKFYKALSLVGTDFALMENIFTVDGKVTRTRRELKLKFKREERLNADFVYRAMYETQTYDVSILDDDPDDELLECPDVDDAPKSKRKGEEEEIVVVLGRSPFIKGGKGQNKPGRKRKKKTELSEDVVSDETVDENDEYAVQEVLIENTLSGEIETAEVLPEPHGEELSEKNHMSVEEIRNPRVQRMRKTKILQDFITDVDSIDDSSGDVLVAHEKPANCNKKQPIQVPSVDSTDLLETLAENVGETLNAVETLYVSRRKRARVLSEDSTEPIDNINNNNHLANTKCELSRSGRIRKTKVLPDFVTDVEFIDETNGENLNSDDELIHTGKRKRIQVLSEDSADESMDAHSERKKNKSIQSPQCLSEKTTECDGDQDVVCLSLADKQTAVLVSDTTRNSSTTDLDDCTVIDTLSLQNEIDGPRVNTTKSVSIGNLLQLPYSKKCNSASEENLLTDAVISEVVTSDKVTRRVRKKAAPNLSKKRPEPQKRNNPSFTNFTPIEEHFSSQLDIKTYSRGAKTHENVLHPEKILEQKQQQDFSSSLYIPKNSPSAANHSTDPPPVMIFTKSPNNENILHLFMVSPPHSSY